MPSARPFAIRFDNGGREFVRVYLIGEKREWLLGRVEPGAIRTLPLPEEVLWNETFVRLAVIPGDRPMLQSARSSGAMLSIAQPLSSLLAERWSFSQGQVKSLRR